MASLSMPVLTLQLTIAIASYRVPGRDAGSRSPSYITTGAPLSPLCLSSYLPHPAAQRSRGAAVLSPMARPVFVTSRLLGYPGTEIAGHRCLRDPLDCHSRHAQ